MSVRSPWESVFWTALSDDLEKLNQNIYRQDHPTLAQDLVPTGEDIEREYGIPIVNKRISVTPIALVGGSACKKPEDFVTIAKTLDQVLQTRLASTSSAVILPWYPRE